MKAFLYTCLIAIGIILVWEGRYYISWFFSIFNITIHNKKSLEEFKKRGTNKRNLSNKDISDYVKLSKKYLKNLDVNYNRAFILNKDLDMHLRFSRFSDKYLLELLYEILDYMKLNRNDIKLHVNHISSKYSTNYAGMYVEKNENKNSDVRDIYLIINNASTIENIISTMAHECTHHLLLSNNIKLDNRLKNECLTDVTTVILGFGKYMVKGYQISNRVLYVGENRREIDKRRIGYLSSRDIKYVMRIR